MRKSAPPGTLPRRHSARTVPRRRDGVVAQHLELAACAAAHAHEHIGDGDTNAALAQLENVEDEISAARKLVRQEQAA